MQNVPGYVAGPLANLRQSMFCNERKQLCFIEYDTLVNNPLSTLQQIYQFLGEPWFNHDFNNVEASYDEFDEQAKIIGLHTVRKKVENRQRKSTLPDDLWNQYAQTSFWKQNFEHVKQTLNWVQINKRPALPQQQTRQL